MPACNPTPRRRALALLFAASAALVAGCATPPVPVDPADRVSVHAARDEVAAGRAVLIDIREADEVKAGLAPGARWLPGSQLKTRFVEIPAAPQPVLLICNTQNRSAAALRDLRARGLGSNVRIVEGGMKAWVAQGLPTVKP